MFAVLENEEILGVLSGVVLSTGKGFKKFLSRRAVIWGGPLISIGIAENEKLFAVNELLININNYCKKNSIYTEFRNFFDMKKYLDVFFINGYKYEKHLNFVVPLENEVSNFNLLRKDKRYELKKSNQNGLSSKIAETEQEVVDFYKILEKLYHDKVKKPLANETFFIEFFKKKELGVILLAIYNEKIVGGALCPVYKDTIYEWYEAAENINIKNLYPSVFATYMPIEFGIKNNLKIYDMMGAGKPDDGYGVREFKSKFGGELVEYGRFSKINNLFYYKLGEIGLKLLNKFN